MTKDELLHRADEFEELGHSLIEHARRLRSHSPTVEQKRLFWPESVGDLTVIAEALLEARRERIQHLDTALLGEPAWDMLLFMFRTFKSGSYVTVGQVYRSSGTYISTARRWLAILVDQGLVEIRNDDADDELKPAQLTELGKIRMTRILVGMEDEFLQLVWSALGRT